jgi:signal transduction histidine kinase
VARGDSGLLDSLIPATLLASHETRLRARTLVAGSLGLAVLALIVGLVRVATTPFGTAIVINFVTVAALASVPVLLRASGNYQLPAAILVTLLVVTLPGYPLLLGAFPAPALLVYPIVPLAAAFFLGRVPGLACALVLSVATLVIGSSLPSPDAPLMASLSRTYMTISVVATLMSAHLAWSYEDARARSEAELHAMNAALEQARQAAESANRSKTEFLQHISHELRTPLNSIVGHGELLRDELADLGHEHLVADVVRIKDTSQHMLALINELLDISRIEAGVVELSVTDVDLGGLVHAVAEAMRPLLGARHNTLTLALADRLPSVATDARRLRQVLLNLLGNACKFTEHGEVTLGAAIAGAELRLWVRDTGVGMTPTQLAKIFEPFVQVDASAERRDQGSGLGLAITRRIVELLGGKISVTSEPGRGSEFTVTLPTRAV